MFSISMLIYLLKVNLALALFYIFYRLFLVKDTFFLSKRILLLSFLMISFVYPLFGVSIWTSAQHTSAMRLAEIYNSIVLPEVTITEVGIPASTVSACTGMQWIKGIYFAVLFYLFIKLLVQFFSIVHIRFQSTQIRKMGYKIWMLNKAISPFSFFHWIFIHPSSHTEEEMREILLHEQTHCSQWHSVDILISEFVCILCWFNPFAWLLRKEISINLEYLADQKVLSAGHDRKAYQYHLLHMSMQQTSLSLMNSFRMLPLKNRIHMMNKRRSHPALQSKYIIWIPLLLLLMMINNMETMARTTLHLTREVANYVQNQYVSDTSEPVTAELQESPISYFQGNNQADSQPFVELTSSLATTMATAAKAKPMAATVAEEQPEMLHSSPAEEESVVFDVVETMPEFPGGQDGMMRFLSTTIKYPTNAQNENIEGRVIAQMVIDTDGTPTDISIVRSVHPDLDREAIRVLSSMPRWTPGKQRGKEVRVRYTVPIRFKLENRE